MKRRATIAVLALTVFATGAYGSWSYAHDYYVFRGFPVLHDPPGIARGRVVSLNVWSPALHGRRTVLVYLPPRYFHGARHGHRYPVLYLLQASVGQASNYLQAGGLGTRIDTLVNAHRIPPFIAVMPGGHGRDHEWANAAAGRYEDYVLDVVHLIDHRFSTLRSRQGRAIAGLSEGGFGAANIALHHLHLFSEFESWSGYYTQTRVFPFANATAAQIAANSPAEYVSGLRSTLRELPTRAFLYHGNREHPEFVGTASFVPENIFAGRLRAAGAHVDTAVYKGGHNWALWRGHLAHMLLWAGQGFPR